MGGSLESSGFVAPTGLDIAIQFRMHDRTQEPGLVTHIRDLDLGLNQTSDFELPLGTNDMFHNSSGGEEGEAGNNMEGVLM